MNFLDALKKIKDDDEEIAVIIPVEGQKIVKIVKIEEDTVVLEVVDGSGRFFLHYTSVYLVTS